MIETLALLDREWIDRQLAEPISDLRKTAACHLLRRIGAQRQPDCSPSAATA